MSKKSKLRENLEAVALALFIAICVKGFVVEQYVVPTGSMVPTITIGDRLFALKFFYGAKLPFTDARLPAFRDPNYGDIVVFLSPFYREPGLAVKLFNPVVHTLSLGFLTIDPQPKFYVKRCIALPGDVVQIKNKNVYVNNRLQRGWWVEYHVDPTVIPPGDDLINHRDYFGPVTVPVNAYFMMGDNRDESYDSRFWGFVYRDQIFARAVFRIVPLARFGPLR
jgi:signal peptidase I